MKRMLLSFIASFMLLSMLAGLATPAFAEGTAPIAENLEIKTYRNTSVDGMLSAYDPESDITGFEITTKPTKGDIKVEPNGHFIYTPFEGKKGRDYFGYKAIDSQGNMSQEATAIIRIEKQKKGVEYSDMDNRAGEYAAVTLSAKGIFTGEKIGKEYYFNPDKAVGCSEFLSMCETVTGKKVISEQEAGSITEKEAAKILNDMMGLNDVEYLHADHEENDKMLQACINLSAVGMIESFAEIDNELTREKAAVMLVKALSVIENR